MNYNLESLSLIASFALAGYLSYRCWTPPNPSPTTPYPTDRVGIWITKRSADSRRATVIALWLIHSAIALTYPPPLLLCPNPDNLSRDLFAWSPYTVICLGLIFIAGSIRLEAFRELGKNFTFRLAKPKEL